MAAKASLVITFIGIIYTQISLVYSQSVNCNNHPFLQKSDKIIQDLLKNDDPQKINATSVYNVVLSQFKNQKPQIVSDSAVGVCSDYIGQQSCCFSAFVGWIDKAALLKVIPLQQASSAYQKLVENYVNVLNSECNSKVLPYSKIDSTSIYNNRNLNTFQSIRSDLSAIKIQFAQNITSYVRGVLCGMCAGVDEVNDYFTQDGKLKIQQDSLNQYVGNTTLGIKKYLESFSQDNIAKIIDEFNDGYISKTKDNGSGVTCAQKIKDKLIQQFANLGIKDKDSQGNSICPGTIAYGDNSACENILQGDSSLNPKSTRRFLFEEINQMKRLLQVTPDAVGDSKTGVNIVTNSTTTDGVIDEFGENIQPDFNKINLNSSNYLVFILLLPLLQLLI